MKSGASLAAREATRRHQRKHARGAWAPMSSRRDLRIVNEKIALVRTAAGDPMSNIELNVRAFW